MSLINLIHIFLHFEMMNIYN